MKSKIRDIVDGCPYPSPIKCTVGASCGECKTLAILALIAADRAGLVEALKEIAMGNGAYNRDPFKHLENCYDHMKEVADSALKGEK